MVVADGPVDSPSTNSGVALGISSALRRRADVKIVQTVDARIRGLSKFALAAVTIRPTRRWWWATFNLGLTNIIWRSWRRDRVASQSGTIDFILQVRNIYLPSKFPYLVFIDSTSDMANRGWSGWRPSAASRRIRRSIERRQFAKAAHVFTAGPQAASSVIEDYQVPSNKVTAIGGGVNYDPLPATVARDIPEVPHLLWVGLDFERKGGDLVIAAFRQLRAQHPNATLTLVGCDQGPTVDGVHYTGKIVDRAHLARLYREATIFCLPARHEPYGLVVQEAMAFSLPCVVSRVGALEDIVDDGSTGLVVAPGDAAALTEALLVLADSPPLSLAMGLNGRQKVERSLTWDRVAERMIASVISKKSIDD